MSMPIENRGREEIDTSTEHTGSNVWEDFVQGYIPEDPIDIHPQLSLHTAYETDVDPVTYEVLRHRLYSINEEHGATLENVSGSPVAYFAQDFNPTILTATGEVVFQGPYIQFFSPIAELQAKWILENRSENPGIEPGDVFISNDTWVGSTHQPDVFFLAPVFREGSCSVGSSTRSISTISVAATPEASVPAPATSSRNRFPSRRSKSSRAARSAKTSGRCTSATPACPRWWDWTSTPKLPASTSHANGSTTPSTSTAPRR